MRHYLLMYFRDSTPQTETGAGGFAARAWDVVASRTNVVRSNTSPGNIPEFALDFEAIEQEARAARSAWFAGKLKSWYAVLTRKFRSE